MLRPPLLCRVCSNDGTNSCCRSDPDVSKLPADIQAAIKGVLSAATKELLLVRLLFQAANPVLEKNLKKISDLIGGDPVRYGALSSRCNDDTVMFDLLCFFAIG